MRLYASYECVPSASRAARVLQELEERGKLGYEDEGFVYPPRRVTASVLMAVDNSLRRMVEVVTSLGIDDNTLFFVHSDNGAWTPLLCPAPPSWNRFSAVSLPIFHACLVLDHHRW